MNKVQYRDRAEQENMARRKDHTREELQEMAIEAAVELISKKGIQEFTARNIAKQIGYTPGTLYNIFPNLQELAARVNQRSLKALETKFLALTKKTNDSADLKGITKIYLDFYTKEPEMWELLFLYPIDEKPSWYLTSIANTFEPIVVAMKRRSKSQVEARRDAKIFWAALHGICSLFHAGKLDVLKQDSLESLTKHLLNRYIDSTQDL